MRHPFASILALLLCGRFFASTASEGGDDLIKLAKSGASAPSFMAHVQESPIAYDLSIDEILTLKKAGLPPDVIAAAVNHGRQRRGELPQEAYATVSAGFQPLVNLIKAGTDENVMLGLLASSTIPYDLSVDEILFLSESGATPKTIDRAVSVGKSIRGKATAEADEAMNRYSLRELIKTSPQAQYVLKDKAGKEFGLNKWTREAATVFVLTDRQQPVRTVVADGSTMVSAEYKTEEFKTEVSPKRTVEVNGQIQTIPAVVETRIHQVCIAPEKTTYTLKNKTVLIHAVFYEYASDKTAFKVKHGTTTIGSDVYEIVGSGESR